MVPKRLTSPPLSLWSFQRIPIPFDSSFAAANLCSDFLGVEPCVGKLLDLLDLGIG